jgi:F-type H+-transporting ATPase subunit b
MHIDWWTLGIQAINVAILIWLLGRFFWRPVAGMIAERRALAEQGLAEAAAKQQAAEAALAEIARTREGFAAERATLLDKARTEAEEVQSAALADTRAKIDALNDAQEADRARAQTEAEARWRSDAGKLALAIAGHLAARLDGAAVRAAFLDWLEVEIRALPAELRETAGNATFDVVSAGGLSADEQTRVAERIQAAFGAPVTLRFRVDPALIAGFELTGPHLALRNSWAADLAQIEASLAHAT